MATEYVRVVDGRIIEFVPRPDWRDDNGNPVPDSVLIANGYYPVDFETNKVTVDPFYQLLRLDPDFSKWQILQDKVVAAYIVEEKTLEEKKQELLQQLKTYTEDKLKGGFTSPSLNITVNGAPENILNLEFLIDEMTSKGQTTIDFRTYDNTFVQLTLDQLKVLLNELKEWRLSVYRQKWTIESQIKNATSIDDLKAVVIEF